MAKRVKPSKRAKKTIRTTKTKKTGRTAKYVYSFGSGRSDGDRSMRDLLGGKGANLAEMTNAGLPVPPGFTISTEACRVYFQEGSRIPASIDQEMVSHLKKLEATAKAAFGSAKNPLLVSVRSGAKFSMPGMMDTVLNLGMNDVTVEAVIAQTDNERFAYDAYRRFIQMFGRIVMGIEAKKWDAILDAAKHAKGTKLDTDLDANDLKQVVADYKD